jgi:hypothetical protein
LGSSAYRLPADDAAMLHLNLVVAGAVLSHDLFGGGQHAARQVDGDAAASAGNGCGKAQVA